MLEPYRPYRQGVPTASQLAPKQSSRRAAKKPLRHKV